MNQIKAVSLALVFALSMGGCGEGARLSEQEYIQLAKDHEAKGDLKTAVIQFKNALQQNPNNAQVRWLLGELYIKQLNGAAAEAELQKAKELGIASESLMASLGESFLLQGKYDQVLEQIKPSAGISTENRAKIMRIQGDARFGLRQLDEACRMYEESKKLDPHHVPAYWGLANCAYAKGDSSLARSHIEAALKVDPTNAESWVALGDLERGGKNVAAAETAYSTALKHDPNKLPALANRMLLYLATDRNEAAQRDLEQVRKVAPRHFLASYLQATMQYATGKTDDALASVQQSLKINPNYMPAIFLLGMVQYEKKAYEQTLSALKRYRQGFPGSVDAMKVLAATYLKLEQPQEALATLQPALAAKVEDAQVFALAGEAYLRIRQPQSASKLFEKATDIVPKNTAMRTQLAVSRLVSGDVAGAVANLQAVVKTDAGQVRADNVLLFQFLNTEQYDKALEVLAELEKKWPKDPAIPNLRGVAYGGKKDYAKARKYFEEALSMQPNYLAAAVNLAELDMGEGRHADAEKRFKDIIGRDKNNVSAMLALAHLALRKKNEQEYVSWLEKASRADGKAIRPRALLANHYLGKKASSKALVIAREALAANPDSAEALSLMAHVQLEAGERENALASYNKLVQMAPNAASAYLGLAKAEVARGNTQDAREALRKALALKPDHTEALTSLATLEMRAGKADEALRLVGEMKKSNPDSLLALELEGDALMAAGRFPQAVQAYEKVLAKVQGSILVIKLHDAMLRAGNAAKGDARLLEWLKAHPEDQIARAHLGDSYGRRGMFPQAVEQYEMLARAVPGSARVLNNLAGLYHLVKDARARQTAEKAYKLEPGNPAYMDTLGWILVEGGDMNRGIKLLEQAVKAAPDYPDARLHLAQALSRSGQTGKARQALLHLQKMRLPPAMESQVKELARQLSGT